MIPTSYANNTLHNHTLNPNHTPNLNPNHTPNPNPNSTTNTQNHTPSYIYSRILSCHQSEELSALKNESPNFLDIIQQKPDDIEIHKSLAKRLRWLPPEEHPEWIKNLQALTQESTKNITQEHLFDLIKSSDLQTFLDYFTQFDISVENSGSIRDPNGNTILHIAMEYDSEPIAEHFSTLFHTRNYLGQFPVDIALNNDHLNLAITISEKVFTNLYGPNFEENPRTLLFFSFLKNTTLAERLKFTKNTLCPQNLSGIYPLKILCDNGKSALAIKFVEKVSKNPILTSCQGRAPDLVLHWLKRNFFPKPTSLDDCIYKCIALNNFAIVHELIKSCLKQFEIPKGPRYQVIYFDILDQFIKSPDELTRATKAFLKSIEDQSPVEKLNSISDLFIRGKWSETLRNQLAQIITTNLSDILEERKDIHLFNELSLIIPKILLGLGTSEKLGDLKKLKEIEDQNNLESQHLELTEQIIHDLKKNDPCCPLFYYLIKYISLNIPEPHNHGAHFRFNTTVIPTCYQLITIIKRKKLDCSGKYLDENIINFLAASNYPELHNLFEWLLDNVPAILPSISSAKLPALERLLKNYPNLKHKPRSLCIKLIKNSHNIDNEKISFPILITLDLKIISAYLSKLKKPLTLCYPFNQDLGTNHPSQVKKILKMILKKFDIVSSDELAKLIFNNFDHLDVIFETLRKIKLKGTKPETFEWLDAESYGICLRACFEAGFFIYFEKFYRESELLLSETCELNHEFWTNLFCDFIESIDSISDEGFHHDYLINILKIFTKHGVIPSKSQIEQIANTNLLPLVYKYMAVMCPTRSILSQFEMISQNWLKKITPTPRNTSNTSASSNISSPLNTPTPRNTSNTSTTSNISSPLNNPTPPNTYSYKTKDGTHYIFHSERSGSLNIIKNGYPPQLMARGYYNYSGLMLQLQIFDSLNKLQLIKQKCEINNRRNYPAIKTIENFSLTEFLFTSTPSDRPLVVMSNSSNGDHLDKISIGWIDINNGSIKSKNYFLTDPKSMSKLYQFLKDHMKSFNQRLKEIRTIFPNISIDPTGTGSSIVAESDDIHLYLTPNNFKLIINSRTPGYAHGMLPIPPITLNSWDLDAIFKKIDKLKKKLNPILDVKSLFDQEQWFPIEHQNLIPKYYSWEVFNIAKTKLSSKINWGASLWKSSRIWFFAFKKNADPYCIPPVSKDLASQFGVLFKQTIEALSCTIVDLPAGLSKSEKPSATILHETALPEHYHTIETLVTSDDFLNWCRQYKNEYVYQSKTKINTILNGIKQRTLAGYNPTNPIHSKSYERMEIQLTQTIERYLKNNAKEDDKQSNKSETSNKPNQSKESLYLFLIELIKHHEYCGTQVSEVIDNEYKTAFNLYDQNQSHIGPDVLIDSIFKSTFSELIQEITLLMNSEAALSQQIHARSYVRFGLKSSGITPPHDPNIPLELQTGENDIYHNYRGLNEDFSAHDLSRLFQSMFAPLFIIKTYKNQFNENGTLNPKTSSLLYQAFNGFKIQSNDLEVSFRNEETRKEIQNKKEAFRKMRDDFPIWRSYSKLENDITTSQLKIERIAKDILQLTTRIEQLGHLKKRKYEQLFSNNLKSDIENAMTQKKRLQSESKNLSFILRYQQQALKSLIDSNQLLKRLLQEEQIIDEKEEKLNDNIKKIHFEQNLVWEEYCEKEGLVINDDTTLLPYLTIKGVTRLLTSKGYYKQEKIDDVCVGIGEEVGEKAKEYVDETEELDMEEDFEENIEIGVERGFEESVEGDFAENIAEVVEGDSEEII